MRVKRFAAASPAKKASIRSPVGNLITNRFTLAKCSAELKTGKLRYFTKSGSIVAPKKLSKSRRCGTVTRDACWSPSEQCRGVCRSRARDEKSSSGGKARPHQLATAPKLKVTRKTEFERRVVEEW